MVELINKSNKEFILVSPYFVPRKEGAAWLSGLIDRGMKVRILTNSLASTDIVAVHSGYENYRVNLVKNGVELYELKPAGNKTKQRLFATTAPAYAGLHSKIYVVDREHVIVGSFNFDPRSIELNTELVLVIHSTEMAEKVAELFEKSIAPDSSYRLKLNDKSNKIIWETVQNDKKVYFARDPKSGFWRRVQLRLMSLLPLEDQL